jgi:hypothetical protein
VQKDGYTERRVRTQGAGQGARETVSLDVVQEPSVKHLAAEPTARRKASNRDCFAEAWSLVHNFGA